MAAAAIVVTATLATIKIATTTKADARTTGSSAKVTAITVIARSEDTTITAAAVIEALTAVVVAAVGPAMNQSDEQARACLNYHLRVSL